MGKQRTAPPALTIPATAPVSQPTPKKPETKQALTVPQLLTMARSGTLEEKRIAWMSLSTVEQMLPTLVKLSDADDVEVTLCAAASFMQLALKPEMRGALVSSGALKQMIKWTTSKNDTVRTLAANGLGALSKAEDLAPKILEHKVLEALHALLSTPIDEAVFFATGGLAQFAAQATLRARLQELPVKPFLLLLTESPQHPRFPEIQMQSLVILGLLCTAKSATQTEIAEQGGMTILFELCKSPLPAVMRQASHLLAKLTQMNEGNQKKLVAEGLSVVAALLHKEDDMLCLNAASILSDVSTTEEGRSKIANANVLPRLVKLVSCTHLEVVYRCCAAIANLSQSPRYKAAFLQENAVPALMGVLEHYSQRTSNSQSPGAAAAAALSVMSANSPECQSAILKTGKLAFITAAASSPAPDIQRHAARLLGSLCLKVGDEGRALIEAGIVRAMFAMLKSSNSEVVQLAVAPLGHLSLRPVLRAPLLAAGALDLIGELMKVKQENATTYTVWAIANLAPEMKARDIEGRGLKEYLESHTTSKNPMLQSEIRRALAAFQAQQTPAAGSEMLPKLNSRSRFEINMNDVEIIKKIGMGGFGEVFKAQYKGQIVAVKKLLKQSVTQDDLDDFNKEVDLMMRLDHPNVLRLLGASTMPPNLAMITEFAENGSLSSLLRTNEFEFLDTIKMCLDAARGMAYLHSLVPIVIHRDLKSENLLVDHEGRLKVADFGISRVKAASETMTQCGTPKYMAPEVLRGEKYDERCDVYSFGIIMWELWTQEELYPNLPSIVAGVRIGFQGLRPPIPEGIESNYGELMVKCWDTKPSNRPSFVQIIQKLEQIQGEYE
eukprot:TRINITY_DN4825_c0_g1_i1.p1 TRINITY_DN4825_c0_g1~~TRINITY_DN4825_c0_g1_i1.p1  ORF type:complete len:900 (+),score=220.70 TRINITY_DN4825_c0_g1_i1:188-2701(+)